VSAWAVKRGFLTAKASRPDAYRAANNILRMASEGRLCLCMRPPGYTSRHGNGLAFIIVILKFVSAQKGCHWVIYLFVCVILIFLFFPSNKQDNSKHVYVAFAISALLIYIMSAHSFPAFWQQLLV